ncbi:hypothetical protein ACFLZJ_02045 [Nanoarchaeota archaeon]
METEIEVSAEVQEERARKKYLSLIMETIENEGFLPAVVKGWEGVPHWIWFGDPPNDFERKRKGFFSFLCEEYNPSDLRKPKDLPAKRNYPIFEGSIGIINPMEKTLYALHSDGIYLGATIGDINYIHPDLLQVNVFGEKSIPKLKELAEKLSENTSLESKLTLTSDRMKPAIIKSANII